MLAILYGGDESLTDVTFICYQCLIKNNIILIPETDIKRTGLFGDPHVGYEKFIYILYNGVLKYKLDRHNNIYIDTSINQVFKRTIPNYIFEVFNKDKILYDYKQKYGDSKLSVYCSTFLLQWNDTHPKPKPILIYNVNENDKTFYDILNTNVLYYNENNNNFINDINNDSVKTLVIYKNIDLLKIKTSNIQNIFIFTEKNEGTKSFLENKKFICIEKCENDIEVWSNPYCLIKN